jgi:hemerythrin superfamily protein
MDTSSSVAGQSVEQLGGPRSVLVRQRADHALLQRLLDEAAATSGREQDEALTRLARLVFPHAYAEETVLWPVVRAVVPDGEQVTLRNEQEHQEINALFSDLDRMPPGPARDDVLRRTAEVLRQDARDEEDLILPRLQAALSGAQLRRLGLTWELVRRTAPTRPHAVVSRRPPGNLLSGAPLSLLDRSRDALDRAARAAPGLAGPLRAASGALALAAGAVEHLPPLRRGEQPSTTTDRPVRR